MKIIEFVCEKTFSGIDFVLLPGILIYKYLEAKLVQLEYMYAQMAMLVQIINCLAFLHICTSENMLYFKDHQKVIRFQPTSNSGI